MSELPERVIKRAESVDVIDGEPVAVSWRGKPGYLFFLRGGLTLVSTGTFTTATPSVPYVRGRASGRGAERTIYFDEQESHVTFSDDAAATEFELRLLERVAEAQKEHQKLLEVERATLEPGQTAGLTAEQPAADGLVRRLERLAQLHASGELDDDEYAAAKSALLRGY